MLQCGFEQLLVSTTKFLEFPFESLLEVSKDSFGPGSFVFMTAHDVHDQRRNQSSRKQIRRQHREYHRFSHGHKKKPGYTCKEKHWNENDADTKGGDERRHCDLLCAIKNC